MLTYTVFSLGEAQLHQLHTREGKVSKASVVPQMTFHQVTVPIVDITAVCNGRGGCGALPGEPNCIFAGKLAIMAYGNSGPISWLRYPSGARSDMKGSLTASSEKFV
jgi:hypothetical protein